MSDSPANNSEPNRQRPQEGPGAELDRLRTILDHSDVLVFLLDRDGVVQAVEGKALRDHNIDPAVLLGLNTVECYTHRPEIAEHVRAALAGQPGQYIATHLGREFECHLNPFRDASGEVAGVVVLGIDVAARLEMERSLVKSQERLALATRAAGIGIWHLDLVSGRLVWDRRQYEMYGVSPDQDKLTYEFWHSLVHPDDRADADQEVKLALEEESEFHIQFRILHPDGAVRHLEGHASVRRDRTGKPIAMIGVNWDITEKMLANQRLRESRSEYLQLFNAMLEGFALHELVFDRDGKPCDYRFLEVNPAFEEMTGVRAAQVLGRTVREIFPETEPAWIERYAKLATTGEPTHFEMFSGSLGKWFEVAAYSPGRGRFACMFRDVTERRRNERRLRTERLVLEALNSSEPQRLVTRRLLHIIREETGVEAVGIRVSDGIDYPYYEYHGFSEAFVQAESSLCLPGETCPLQAGRERSRLVCLCGRVIQGEADPGLPFFTEGGSFWTNRASELLGGEAFAPQGELRGRCLTEGYESLALIPLVSGDEVIGLLQLNDHQPDRFAAEDIEFYETLGASIGVSVARAREQQARRDSEERLHHILDSLDAGVVAVDMATESVTYANPAACRLLAMPRDFLVGLPVRRLSPDGVGVEAGEGELLAMDGRRVPVLRTLSQTELNERPCLLLSFLDLTPLRLAETERKLFQERLAQTQRLESIGTLAGGIAHDFNNILHAILGFSELALDDCPEGSEARESMREVLKASNRAKELVNQILTFSRQGENEKVPLRLQSILREIAKLIRGTIPASIAIHTEVAGELPPVWADPSQMHQVLMNLCTNAYQAIRRQAEGEAASLPSGEIRLRLRSRWIEAAEARGIPGLTAGQYLELSVSDTGCGIPPDIRGHIFEPYFTTRTKERGTGLGLAIVQGVVQAHGGSVDVESRVGHGTTFRMLLPAHEGEESAPGQQSLLEPRLSATVRVLLVDDEAPIRHLAERGLPHHGYDVTVAGDGKSALEIFQRNPDGVDILVTDLAMPGMSGIELAREVLRMRPDLPVVLCSGFSETVTREEAMQNGIRELANKPLSPRELAELMRGILQSDE